MSQHERRTRTRCGLVYAKSQVLGARRRCNLPSYREYQQQQQQQQPRPPAHAVFYVFVDLPTSFDSPMLYIEGFARTNVTILNLA